VPDCNLMSSSSPISTDSADPMTHNAVDRRQECRQSGRHLHAPKLPPFPQSGDARFIPRTGWSADRHR
jgi:hypothetical protein